MNPLDYLKQVFFQLDRNGNFVHLNDSWEVLTGLQVASAINQSWLSHICEQDQPIAKAKLQHFYDGGKDSGESFECRLYDKQSSLINVEVFLMPLVDVEGINGFVGSFLDITEIKLKLQQLHLDQERLSWALHGANDGYWDWSLETDYVYYSPRWKTMLGYAEDEPVAPHLETWAQLVDPDDKERTLKFAGDYLAGQIDKYEIEFRMKHKDGSWVYILSRASLARDKAGHLIMPKRLIGTHVDLTERKKSELLIEKQSIALEATANAIVITDAHARVEWVNPAFLKLTGYSLKEALGRKMQDLVKSGHQDEAFYKKMWKTISAKKIWRGDLVNKNKDGIFYNEYMTITPVIDRNDQISNFIAIKEDISQRKASEKEIQELAFYDSLTGLPNRRLFMEQLQHAVLSSSRHQSYSALLFIDLDNFKIINDTYGHDVGDLFLTDVASRINLCVRNKDIVARLGGDEFVILLEQLGSDSKEAISITLRIGKKIIAHLNQEYCAHTVRHKGSGSIGICMFLNEYDKAEDILKRADTAMYKAKDTGRNQLCFFDPLMQQELEHRAQLEKELWQAIANKELCLYYQIIINDKQAVVGVEALLRWLHPERGIVGPDKILSLIESNNMIIPIGDWIVDEGLKQLSKWQKCETLKILILSLNISAVQFQKEDFVTKLSANIKRRNIDCSRLYLELTESSLIYDIESTINKIEELRGMGIHIAIDDFGTGYSSLSYLKQFKLDQLKIERLFVRDILIDQDDLILVKTIINMGKNLGLDVVAEGVENQQQFEVLKAAGCTKFQGYWVNRPIPEKEINALLRSGKMKLL
jgi:diguanylate cyclase (GGDEF)-like protein/PAS domain S-box-containing protein